jgi:UDP-N-acetylmuramoyl-tripeptide--D-alanyl-D-alanine ligase
MSSSLSSPSSSQPITAAHFSSEWISETLARSLGRPEEPSTHRGRQASREFKAITTDSRKIRGGELFVAVKGETHDGHDYIESALKSGAAGVLCSRMPAAAEALARESGSAVWVTPDVQQAYRALGASWRRRFSIPVIVVAGSNGKTTTKEFLSAILRGKWPSVLKTQGSQNGFLGIPMTLLELRSEHGAAVIEVGIDDVGAMSRHIECVHPTQAVLTVIGPEHLENLKDVPTVAREELIALEDTLALGGRVAIHLDDPWIAPFAEVAKQDEKPAAAAGPAANTLFSLRSKHEEPRATVRGSLTAGATLEITTETAGSAGERFELPLPLPGRHNAQNLLAAVSVAIQAGLTPAEIARGLESFSGAEGRSQVRPLPPSRLVICDYYNASPVSMEAAFELLAATGETSAARWACLADMKELGPDELKFHRELAPRLLATRPKGVLLHGDRMKSLFEELRLRGYTGELAHFETPEALAAALRTKLGPGDVVLIKGSRSMKMEKVWESLSR